MTDQPTAFYVYSHRTSSDALTFAVHEAEFPLSENARAAWRVDGASTADGAVGALLSLLAGHWPGSPVTITQLIPRPATADEKLDAARSALRADYWQDVQNVVADLRAQIERGNITDPDDAQQWLDDTVDGHQRVIYTSQAIECLRFSRNGGAYYDEWGETPDMSDGSHWSELAYSAFRADIMAEIGDIEGFIDTHNPAPYGVCYQCDRDIDDEDDNYAEDGDGVAFLCADCKDDQRNA